MRPLSYSQISLYLSCPLSYKLQYIDGLQTKAKWYFSFGSVLHLCAEYFYKAGLQSPPSLDELLNYYEDNWISQGYESPEKEKEYRKYGQEILTEFRKINSRDFKMPVALERSFKLDIDGVKLRGFIDRIDKLESGGLSIIDYKSNKELFTKEDLQKNLQLTLYQIAADQLWLFPVEKLGLYHLRSNSLCSCNARSKKQIEDAKRIVLDVAENIEENRSGCCRKHRKEAVPRQGKQLLPLRFPRTLPLLQA